MRAIIQRVQRSTVTIHDNTEKHITHGIVMYVCFSQRDTKKESEWLVKKILSLRIFNGDDNRFSRTLMDVQGQLMIIPNFTLYAEIKKGTRPSFSSSMNPDEARIRFYELVAFASQHIVTQSGEFGDHMLVMAQVDGPVNIIVDVPLQNIDVPSQNSQ